MMKNFIVSWPLTRDLEPKEDSGRRDVMPFPEEDAVLMVYDGHPPPFAVASHVQPESQDPNSLRLGTQGHRGVFFPIYMYLYIYTLHTFQKKEKTTCKMDQGHRATTGRSFNPSDWC
jgi:hypothetical protein